jgi:hypothetical protein
MGKRAKSSKDDPDCSRDRETNKRKPSQAAAFGASPKYDDSEKKLLLQMAAIEGAAEIAALDTLLLDGFDFPPPERLDDPALSAKLNELIHTLADYYVFLDRTDHLSDRELYTWLCGHALRHGLEGFGMAAGWCMLDVLGGCSKEDIALHMRYYADDDDRARLAAEWPEFPMPPKEAKPYDRDGHLPKP